MGLSGMNRFAALLLALFVVLIPCGLEAQDLPAAAAALDAEKAAYLHRHQADRDPAELERIFVTVRENGVLALPDAVAKLEEMGEEELLIILLASGEPYPRGLAAESIGRIGSKPYLGSILRCLDAQGRYHHAARSDTEGDAINRRHHQSLITAIERISKLKYMHPDFERESVTAFIAEVRGQEQRPDKRPGSGGTDEAGSARTKGFIRHPGTVVDNSASLRTREKSWLEVCVGGALAGYAILYLFQRMRRKDDKS